MLLKKAPGDGQNEYIMHRQTHRRITYRDAANVEQEMCFKVCLEYNICCLIKLAAQIFNVSIQTHCTFIPILKLYVTHTACVAKWRPLKHNDYETIIIWRSTGGGPHPKCSPHAAYKSHARAVALICRRNFRSLSLLTCLSADLHCFPSPQ